MGSSSSSSWCTGESKMVITLKWALLISCTNNKRCELWSVSKEIQIQPCNDAVWQWTQWHSGEPVLQPERRASWQQTSILLKRRTARANTEIPAAPEMFSQMTQLPSLISRKTHDSPPPWVLNHLKLALSWNSGCRPLSNRPHPLSVTQDLKVMAYKGFILQLLWV